MKETMGRKARIRQLETAMERAQNALIHYNNVVLLMSNAIDNFEKQVGGFGINEQNRQALEMVNTFIASTKEAKEANKIVEEESKIGRNPETEKLITEGLAEIEQEAKALGVK